MKAITEDYIIQIMFFVITNIDKSFLLFKLFLILLLQFLILMILDKVVETSFLIIVLFCIRWLITIFEYLY